MTLVAVKVLSTGGSGTLVGVIAGIDFVTKDHLSRGRDARSVANMSLGGSASAALDTAVEQSVASGVNHAVAAGNDNADSACNHSPARVPGAITVGATTNTDTRASYSNVGPCVDIFAPGSLITSAWIGSNTAISTISGTSMATPHVAGAVAAYLGHFISIGEIDIPTPVDVVIWIRTVGTKDIVKDVGTGSPNILLFSPFSDV